VDVQPWKPQTHHDNLKLAIIFLKTVRMLSFASMHTLMELRALPLWI